MEENGIEVREYNDVSSDVSLLAQNQLKSSTSQKTGNSAYEAEGKNSQLIWADPGTCCYALYTKLDSAKALLQQSPLALAKALKVTFTYSYASKSMTQMYILSVTLCSYVVDVDGVMCCF